MYALEMLTLKQLHITDSLDLIFLASAYTYTNIICEQQYITVQGVGGVASYPP